MNISSLICDICCVPYDNDQHDPRIIPSCFHTLCLTCIKHLIKPAQNKINCPFCKKEYKMPQLDPSNFPKNYAISSGCERKDVCKEHSIHHDIICITCQVKICNRCYLRGNHKDHDIEYLEDLTREISAYLSDLEDTAKRVEKYNTIIRKILNMRKQTLKHWVEVRYKSLIDELNRNMHISFEKIEAYFGKLNIGPIINFKEGEELQSKLLDLNLWKKEVNDLITLWEKRDPFETNSLLKKKIFYLSDINTWLQQDPQIIAKSLSSSIEINFNDDLISKFSEFCDISANHQDNHINRHNSEIYDKEMQNLIQNYIGGKFSEDQIVFRHNYIKQEAPLDEIIKETTYITIGPTKATNLAHLLNPLKLILWNFQKAPTVSIQLQNSKLPQEEIQKFFDCLVCLNPHDIDINLTDSAQMGLTLAKFSDYLKTARNLTMLSLVFRQCFIFETGIQAFQKSLAYIPKLQELTIDLEECLTVNSDDFTSLMQSISRIPSLRHLGLNLTKCDQFEPFNVSDLIELLNSLDVEKFRGLSLMLGFLDKHILSKSLIEKLFTAILRFINLNELKIFLRDNDELSDEHIVQLAIGLPGMKKLESLDLNFDFYQLISEKRMLQRAQQLKSKKKGALSPETSGYITDEGVIQMSRAIGLMNSLTYLKLDFSGYERLTDESVCKLYQAIQNLKGLNNLDISFDQCYLITDAAMKNVSKCIFTLSKLTEIRVRFENSEITAKGISLLERSFAFLANVTKINFGFCCSSKEIDPIKSVIKTIGGLKSLKACNITISLTDKANNIELSELKDLCPAGLDLSITTKPLFKT